jgi:hypothetical protein
MVSGEYTAHTDGDSWVTMLTVGNNFCFLVKVAIQNADTEGEWPTCQIFIDPGKSSVDPPAWVLMATSDSDSDAECTARCLSW